jgi:hypothetical protein
VLTRPDFHIFGSSPGDTNNAICGLAGGLWTRDLARAHRISRAMQ